MTSIRRAAAADCAPIWAVHTRAIRHGRAPHYASLNAVPFYLALGYRIEGDLRHALGGGHAVACKLMSKRLAIERPAT